ncbi:MAG TPA: hypothetical protein VMV12_07020 [Candidatus Micrarchaeaceae archaeon]|nr:hypothetical protein [Candidatus Micrarchaeaceae archaeon]
MSPPLHRRHRLLLGLYPPSFRERYGDELQALVEDTSSSQQQISRDLALGALRAWAGWKVRAPVEQGSKH